MKKIVKPLYKRRREEWASVKELSKQIKHNLAGIERLNKKGDLNGAVKVMEKHLELTDKLDANCRKLRRRDDFLLSLSKDKRES